MHVYYNRRSLYFNPTRAQLATVARLLRALGPLTLSEDGKASKQASGQENDFRDFGNECETPNDFNGG